MPFSQLADCSLKSLSFPFSAPVFLKGHLKYLCLPALRTLLPAWTLQLLHAESRACSLLVPNLLQSLYHQSSLSNLIFSSHQAFLSNFYSFFVSLVPCSRAGGPGSRNDCPGSHLWYFQVYVLRAVQLRWDLSNPCNSWRILDTFLMTLCRSIPKMFCYRNDYVRWVGARETFKGVNRTCRLPGTGD